MQFTDRMVTDGVLRKTDDGHVVQARVARGGNVQDYLGSELGDSRPIVRVYRPSGAVFHKDAIATYARKPITIGHPAGGVTDATWKDLAVGEIDRDVMRDGEFVSVPLLFRDAAAVALMNDAAGPKELSMGYTAQIDMQDGVTPDGQPFDAIMSDFKMNHVAVVPRARGGADLRIGDSAATWGAAPITVADNKEGNMSDNLQTVVLGDQAAQVALADAPKIEAFKAASVKALSDAEAKHVAAMDALKEELGAAKADLKKANDAAMTPEKMTKLVADRVALETVVKAIDAKIETANVSDADLRKAAVTSVHGAEMVADADDAEVRGMFKAVAKDAANADPVAKSIEQHKPAIVGDAVAQEQAAYAAMLADFNPQRKEA